MNLHDTCIIALVEQNLPRTTLKIKFTFTLYMFNIYFLVTVPVDVETETVHILLAENRRPRPEK
jgi:hypothetical protein